MRRLCLIVVGACLSLSGCVVIQRESAPPPAGTAGDMEVPLAEPADLAAASDRRLVGSLGWALLSPEVPNAVVEIDQLGGARLSQAAIEGVVQALRDHGGKQRVEIVTSDVETDKQVYSLEDLVRTSQEHRDHSSGGDTVALHVLVLPGSFEAEGVPGATFHATAMALFPDEIGGRLPPGSATDAFEVAVAIHELGHTFGLVNRTGVGEFHEDPDRPGHTGDDESVMYWAIESSSLTELFRSGPPSQFTEDDRREMEMIRAQRP